MVARGFSQTKGVDYFETFSLVARYESVRTVIATAAKENMELVQFDVKSAFLNWPLEEDIYMCQSPGYEEGSEYVCHIRRGLYGLKQASRNLKGLFNDFMIGYGFVPSPADSCVFIINPDTDDRMILCSMENFIYSLKKKFENPRIMLEWKYFEIGNQGSFLSINKDIYKEC